MKDLLVKILPNENIKRKWTAVIITAILSSLLTLFGIYGIGQYGIALFILTPLFIGFSSTILYGLDKSITKNQSWLIGQITLALLILELLVFAVEGIICIGMAVPFAIFFTSIGSLIGFRLLSNNSSKGPLTILILIGIIPSYAFIERQSSPTLISVITSIEINADAQTVWKNVIEFPQLDEPTEFIFKIGIAYPINAKIDGTGVGAVRHCNFTTGSFVEPITVWNEPRLLKFDVVKQPPPMKELSFWDINAPHLHDYFVSKQGQFKLTALPNCRTLLEGTTWYYHNIRPAIYWRLWSNHIIHKIHDRVLTHIKTKSESVKKSSIYSQHINQKLNIDSLEMSALASELDCEEERANQFAYYLKEREGKTEKGLIIGSIIVGAAGAVATEAISNKSSNEKITTGLTIGVSLTEATLGALMLINKRKIEFYHNNNALTDIWKNSDDSNYFPPSIWYYLTYENPNNNKKSLAKLLVDKWMVFG